MLVEESIQDGKFIKHYSDSNKLIRQIETMLLYAEATDIVPCPYTYRESVIDLPPEMPMQQKDESDEDYQIRYEEYQKAYAEWVEAYEQSETERILAEEEAKQKAEEEAKQKAEEEARLQKEAEEAQELQTVKDGRIAISKLNLATWLENHPYTFTKTDGTSDVYSVTSEKQQLLALEVMTDQMMVQAGLECQPTWNAVGEVCENWNLTDLQRLALEIRQYIKPKIAIQQHTEAEIQACVDKNSVMDISVGVEIYD